MWESNFWALPLAVFVPSVLLLLLGRWAIGSITTALKEISNKILEWHGSQDSLEAHEKMWKKFLESDYFREKLNEHVKHKIDNAITPLNLKMDLLDRNMQLATANLTKEVGEKLEKFKNEVIAAVASTQGRESREAREFREARSDLRRDE